MATTIVLSKKKHAGRVSSPSTSNRPPPTSEIAAINPIPVGARFIPRADNAPPSFVHTSGPPVSLGKP
nr:hypothetical protein [Candidatus Scalindua japonica]